MRPLILLDIRRPANSTEIWRQLALRNLFATELFNWENTGGIFATGLFESEDQEVVLESLIAGVAAGKSYGEIASQSNPQIAAPADSSNHLRSVGATVLWSHDPRLSLLPPSEEKPL